MKKPHASFIDKEIDKWKKYFNVEVRIHDPSEITDILKTKIDILLLDASVEKTFKLEYYKKFQNKNYRFKYIILKNKRAASDVDMYKRLCDRVVYTDEKKLASWEIISLLRRYWNTNSKSTTIIFRSLIADFVDNTISVEGKNVSLTLKEISVLRVLLLKKNEYIPKDVIYKKVWKFDDRDTTRVLDQIIFKLKKKIGKDYFKVSRSKGVMIN